jgi:hypothetical protein
VQATLTLEQVDADGVPVANRPASQINFRISARNYRPTAVPLPEFEERNAEPLRLRATLTVPGLTGCTASQDTVIVALNALQVTLAPINGNNVAVQVSNPSGEPFVGRIHLEGGRTAEALSLRLAQGSTDATVVFHVTPEADRDGLQFVIEAPAAGRQGWKVVSRTPAIHVKMLESFAEYAADTTPPSSDYLVVPDGDANIHSRIEWTVVNPPPGLPIQADRAARITYSFDPGW